MIWALIAFEHAQRVDIDMGTRVEVLAYRWRVLSIKQEEGKRYTCPLPACSHGNKVLSQEQRHVEYFFSNISAWSERFSNITNLDIRHLTNPAAICEIHPSSGMLAFFQSRFEKRERERARARKVDSDVGDCDKVDKPVRFGSSVSVSSKMTEVFVRKDYC